MLANSLGGRGVLGGGRGAGADGAVNAQRMRTLEGQVLQAKMESNESKEDAAKVRGKPNHARRERSRPISHYSIITILYGAMRYSRRLSRARLVKQSSLLVLQGEASFECLVDNVELL